MRRPLKPWIPALLLLVATLGAVAWVVFTTRTLRNEARARFFEQYNRQQLLVAEQAARNIEGVFATFRRNLTLVASLFRDGEVTEEHASRVSASLRTVYQVLGDTPVIDVVVFDRVGTVAGIVPEDPTTLGKNYSWRDYFRWAQAMGKPGQMYLSRFERLEGGQQRGANAVMVAEGIYGPRDEFKGVVMFTVNFDELARRHVLSIRMGESGYAWLLDSNNRSILVEPSGKIAGQSFEKAFLPGWPRLYGLAVASREGRPGLDWYDFWDAGRPGHAARKLVGYAPVRIEGFLWTLGVCTPVKDVERLLSSFLDRQQLFSGMVLLAVVAGGAVLLVLLTNWNRSLSREVTARTRDLTTAQEKLEATFGELLSTKKLAAVGHLALGLAHEIRNPLSSIRMNMQMLRKRMAADGPSLESFAIMEEEILRLNRLLTEVMTFARPVDLEPKPSDLREVVERVLRLLAHRLEEAVIAVRVPWDLDCPPVVCDAEQLQQVFLNLFLNAVQAMEGQRGERRLTVRGRWSGENVSVDVSDTGPGVAPENLDNVFNPFFTTKAQGTGLGLSLLQRIVVRHGGWVELRSPPGEGATFTVHLPVNGPPDPQGMPT